MFPFVPSIGLIANASCSGTVDGDRVSYCGAPVIESLGRTFVPGAGCKSPADVEACNNPFLLNRYIASRASPASPTPSIAFAFSRLTVMAANFLLDQGSPSLPSIVNTSCYMPLMLRRL